MKKSNVLQMYASEMYGQAEMPIHSSSALINMLSKSVLKDGVLVNDIEDRLLLTLTRYWKHRAFRNKTLQLAIIEEISKCTLCKYAISSAIDHIELTTRNLKQGIKLSLSRVADVLLQTALDELSNETRNN